MLIDYEIVHILVNMTREHLPRQKEPPTRLAPKQEIRSKNQEASEQATTRETRVTTSDEMMMKGNS